MQSFRILFFTLTALVVISIAVYTSGLRAVSFPVAQALPVPVESTEELLTFFYKDPRPERLVGFFERFESSPASGNWEAYPPMAGFFAAVFRAHPDQVESLLPDRFNQKSAMTIAAALRLSDNEAIAMKLQAKLDRAGSDKKLKVELAGLPTRLEELSVRTPSHLDILWGAAFASGDDRFVTMIVDFFARTANRSELVAIDVAKIVLAFMGGPKEILTELRSKYGDALAREIIFAASALWALQSNAIKHSFVERAVTKFGKDHAGMPAAKALAFLRLNGK